MHCGVEYESQGRGRRTSSRLQSSTPREMPFSAPGKSYGRGRRAAVWRGVETRGSSLYLPGLPFSGFGSGR